MKSQVYSLIDWDGQLIHTTEVILNAFLKFILKTKMENLVILQIRCLFVFTSGASL